MPTQDHSDSRDRFLELLHAHQRLLAKVCSAYAATSEERADLFQEISLQLWRAWPSFRAESTSATWAFRIALNTSLFRRRTARSGRTVAFMAAGSDGLDTVPAPSAPDPAESAEEARILYACIRTLRELDRAIVLLHLEDRTHPEIAEITGLSTGNVAVRLHRIRAALRTSLQARGLAPE